MSTPDSLASKYPSSLRILIAEDNLTNQKLMLRQLQLLGYDADLAVDGQAAVDAVKQFSYDVVLMDCQMPVLDGFDATIAIRQWEQQRQSAKSIMVIAMTASNLEHDRQRAAAIGMNDYLTKPIHKEELAVLLDRCKQFVQSGFLEPFSGTGALAPVAQATIDPCPLLPAHLDFSYLHRLCDNTPDFELELLQIFLQDSQNHLKRFDKQFFSKIFNRFSTLLTTLKEPAPMLEPL